MNLLQILRQTSRGQVIVKNTLWLGLASGLAGLGDFVLTVYVIRKFGASTYGVFGYAFSFVSLFGALFDLGLSTAITRQFAGDRGRERHFGDLLTLRLVLGAGGIAVVWLCGVLITPDPLARRMIFLLAIYVALLELANFFSALFRARQQMQIEAGFRLAYIVCLIVLVVGLTTAYPSVVSVAVAYLAAIAATVIGAAVFVVRAGGVAGSLRLRIDLPAWREYLLIGLFLALLRVAGDVNQNIGTVTLGYLGRLAQIGWYNAADKIYGVLLFPMALVSTAMFPALAQARRAAPDRLVPYWKAWARGTVLVSVGLSFLIFVDARAIIELLYPAGFAPAVLTLRILVVAALITYLQSLYYTVLLVVDRERALFAAGLGSTAVHVALNFLLVPWLGLYGVALGTVLSQAVMCGLCIALVARGGPIPIVDRDLLQTLAVAVVAGLALSAVLAAAPHGRVWVIAAALAGVLVYGALVLVGTRILPAGSAPRGEPGTGH